MKDFSAVLKKYASVMDVNPPAEEASVKAYKEKNDEILPQPFIDLLKLFNGGEVFVPGTVIYGVPPAEDWCSLEQGNADNIRQDLQIDDDYLIIAQLNFGDLVCIYKHAPYDLIQWCVEEEQPVNDWNCIEDWLKELTQEYEDYLRNEE